jgi:hypothetical protein
LLVGVGKTGMGSQGPLLMARGVLQVQDHGDHMVTQGKVPGKM